MPHVQLAKEILYDIKQAELGKIQQQQPAAKAAAARPTPAAAAANRSVRRSPPPTGVMPDTPVAAEVLATAERQRSEQLQQLRAQQQEAAGAGGMPAPLPRPSGQVTPAAAAGVVQTPAAASASKSRLPGSSASGPAAAAAGVFKTPAAKTPRSASSAAGRSVLASPAPLTVGKSGSRLRRSGCAAADEENQDPGAAGVPLAVYWDPFSESIGANLRDYSLDLLLRLEHRA